MKWTVLFCAAWLWLTGCAHAPKKSPALSLRILSYNIHHGRGMDDRVDLQRIADLINKHQPDLVALQEVDKGTTRTDGRDLARELAALCGMDFVFGQNIPYQGGGYGNAILSRFPIQTATSRHYRMLRDGEQRGLLQTEITVGGQTIRFACTHLDYRPENAERLSNVAEIQSLLGGKTPVILAGDFNDHPGQPVHQAMMEQFDDAWELGGVGEGFTYSSTRPKSRIDYVYFAPKGRWIVTRAEVLESTASDHLPLLVEAVFTD